MTKELKPCPFCGGGEVDIFEGSIKSWVRCKCGACGVQKESNSLAIKAWNTRPAAESLARALEELFLVCQQLYPVRGSNKVYDSVGNLETLSIAMRQTESALVEYRREKGRAE